uniref:Aldolase_II domain-containing protein n=1 Tax=Caenorhabditis tropicalis TaxID=1561998 RepID=A0A1I7TP00_9PELO
MSDDSDNEIRNDEPAYSKTASYAFLSQRLTTVSERKCIIYSDKLNKQDCIVVMQTADSYPEFINNSAPSEPGFSPCELYVMNKSIGRTQLSLDNFTPWFKGGKKNTERHHSYYYFLNGAGEFKNCSKESGTHLLRIIVTTVASCPGLNKKIYRMSRIDSPLVHCLPSLIVYTFESGHPRASASLPGVLNTLENSRMNGIISNESTPSTSFQSVQNEWNTEQTPPKRPRNDHSFISGSFDFSTTEGNDSSEAFREIVVKEEPIDNHSSSSNIQTSNISSSSTVVQQNSKRRFQNYDMFSAGVISNATVPSPMFHPHITPIADVKDNEKYDSEERIQRNKLAALYRLVDLFRWSQGIYNHITVRVSTDPDEILINAFGQFYNEVSASSLIKVDLDGTVIDGGSTSFGVNQAGYVLHSAIHNGRPEVKCVVHLHHPSVVAVSAQKCGLLPISQEAMIVGEVGYHEYRGILIDEAERALLIRDLGDRNVLILRNHGFVVCGESIEHALSLTYHLIIACETQVKAVPGGNTDNVHFPAQSAIKQVYKVASNGGGGVNRQNGHVNSTQWRKGELEWQAYMRQLDAQGYVTGHEYN